MEIEIDIPDPDTTCEICYAEFLDSDDLLVHFNQVHSSTLDYSLKKCDFCEQRFSDLEQYAYHLRDVHLSSLRACNYCNKVFSDTDQYRKHETKHYAFVNKTKYSCSSCKLLFTNLTELEHHEVQAHKDNGVVLSEVLPLLSSMINKKAICFLHSLTEQSVYACIVCHRKTKDAVQYLNHLKKHGCKTMACDMCSSVFKKKNALCRHFDKYQTCFHSENYHLECPECLKIFPVKLWKDHTKNCKAIKCNICNIVFDTMDNLTRHQSNIHPLTVLLVTCKYCNKDFAGTTALEKHIQRTHSSQIHLYKYLCVYCEAKFKHPNDLFKHFYSNHKELSPYTCKICDKTFRIRKRFTIHIKLDHKSIGFIEFDKNYHVFFNDKKSKQPVNRPTLTETERINIEESADVDTNNDTGNNTDVDKDDDTLETDKINKKVQFNVEEKDKREGEINLVNVNSDFMSATETEGESQVTQPLLKERKSKRIRKRVHKKISGSDSSDDEPLLNIQKREIQRKRFKYRHATWNRKRTVINDKKKRFICPLCKKNCFTFLNYNNHVSLHYQNVTKCIKCSKDFSTNDELKQHCAAEHASSQLTQTLKNLLEKRKNRVNNTVEPSNTEKFRRTIKKVDIHKDDVPAKVTVVNNSGLSVQKFIESFTPEEVPKKESNINTNICIKPVSGVYKEPSIKMTKCNLDHLDFKYKGLAFPVKFKQTGVEIQATIKLSLMKVQTPPPENESYCEDSYMEADDFHDNSETIIPDVAQEVMLGSEDPKSLYVPHKVVIPKLPKDYKDIRIAHLQPEAPFYKIVKVDEVLHPPKPLEVPPEPKKDIKLPDGTHLVSVNPLAHLLGDTPVEKIVNATRSKYYQHKSKDFETAIANAMLKLNKTKEGKKKQKKVAEKKGQ